MANGTMSSSRIASVHDKYATFIYLRLLTTTTNMIPVMASTNIERLKIDFAGADSGVKILVRGESECSASAFGANKKDDKANIASSLTAVRIVIEFVVGRIRSNSSTVITGASVQR